MTFKSLLVACMLGLSMSAWAQRDVDLMDWKEIEVPPPPAFDVGKLLTFEVSSGSSLVYGVDPATLNIGKDGIVRYVMVASNATGARNVWYEGIRCATGEFKTYARHTTTDGWRKIDNADWRSVFGNLPSKHAVEFARAGACDNTAPASSVYDIVRQLKAGRFNQQTWGNRPV